DVGGFVGEASTKLFARWISIGALSPFFRGHTMINTKDSEPWSFGEEVEQISRNYIKLRYQLLPYLYSLFHEAAQTGMPVQRSLAIYYPHDARVYNGQFHHQYLFGPHILVAPVESNKEFAKVFFPPGKWYSIFDGQVIGGDRELIVETPIHRLPVYIKAGAIIPMQRPVSNTKERVDELVLHVYHGDDASDFEYYEDDGTTYQFESGLYATRSLQFNPATRTIRISPQSGTYESGLQSTKLVLHGFGDIGSLQVNGNRVKCEAMIHSFFTPLEKYDPINDPDSMGEEQVLISRFPYSTSTIEISW
ncbi:MAG TPA: TIM-barrel domain-containing protein, partial [Cyclobacteriaceae bacterium]|nr:TIM-barrel domain-containing protein [Cyclobacteriaceae bacterium]